MSERSVAQVRSWLLAERKERDQMIARQSFYCTRRNRLVTPSYCHDCFASLPYLERLTRWNEQRMRCVAEHREKTPYETLTSTRQRETKREPRESLDELPEVYSIEEYMSLGLLEFLLDLDSLSQRFETWWCDLADAARARLHESAELGEMILWFADRLAEFERTLVLLARSPEELAINRKTKEEPCGVKNSQ